VDTASGLREARAKLRALPADHPAKPVTETPEFFVLSGLHDLIFNVKKHRFTPIQLKELFDEAGLKLLVFDYTDPSTPQQYAKPFPDDLDQTNLDNWEMFEQNHPHTFAKMYQMWCRPVD
tara:strand:+ start:134 stop:493 length:360 start_codon:yes stop_codon:yes gene_type:complete